jgi:hypothetical protein
VNVEKGLIGDEVLSININQCECNCLLHCHWSRKATYHELHPVRQDKTYSLDVLQAALNTIRYNIAFHPLRSYEGEIKKAYDTVRLAVRPGDIRILEALG